MEATLRLMLALLAAEHQRPNHQMRDVAAAIAAQLATPAERAALIAVAYLESGFGRAGDLRFGVMPCRTRWRCDTREEARIALRSLRSTRGVCRTAGWALRLSRYNNGRITRDGRCVENAYGRRAAAMVGRMRGRD